ncbi:NepR family anti-sigma factor [Bosea sp. PAMC 26642]|uniref:NepR family anti-sigma factor n=1 Tax=Bosea sp. (strain PAMC 26642) TaxID=1792307 RepID=UPI000A40B0F5|nr:NepR family anti-sigma factor [Bosea sp. PAMC 26642]
MLEERARPVCGADMNGTETTMTNQGGAGEYEPEMVLDPRVQESIGRSLKAHYDDLINAPIPDKFLVLLAQLEAKEHSASAGDLSDERH